MELLEIESTSLAAAIKRARVNAGISQAEMASRLGFSASRYSNYENNIRSISGDTLVAICKELNISLSELLKDSYVPEEFSAFIAYLGHVGYSAVFREQCVELEWENQKTTFSYPNFAEFELNVIRSIGFYFWKNKQLEGVD